MRVLIIKLTSMGDLVQALPALSDAQCAHPGIQFDWVADEAFAEIPSWHPAVNQVIASAHRRWRGSLLQSLSGGQVGAFLRTLRANQYDAVIDLQGNLKSALVSVLARGAKYGLDKKSVREYPAHWAYGHRFAIDKRQLAVERWRQLLAAALDYSPQGGTPNFGLSGHSWPKVGGLPDRPFLIFVPNATWESKSWPDTHWRELAKLAGAEGYQVLIPWGSSSERERSEGIAQGLAQVQVLPRHCLAEVAAIVLQSAGAICVDTGLAHLAAALGTPTLTVYGPTDPALIGATGPLSRHWVATGYPCIPCYRRRCNLPGEAAPGEAQCLQAVTPEAVWRSFLALKQGERQGCSPLQLT